MCVFSLCVDVLYLPLAWLLRSAGLWHHHLLGSHHRSQVPFGTTLVWGPWPNDGGQMGTSFHPQGPRWTHVLHAAYIYIYIYINIYIYTCNVNTRTHTYIHTYIHTHIYIYVKMKQHYWLWWEICLETMDNRVWASPHAICTLIVDCVTWGLERLTKDPFRRPVRALFVAYFAPFQHVTKAFLMAFVCLGVAFGLIWNVKGGRKDGRLDKQMAILTPKLVGGFIVIFVVQPLNSWKVSLTGCQMQPGGPKIQRP